MDQVSPGVLDPQTARTKFTLRKTPPSPALSPFVEYFWQVSWNLTEPFTQRVIPHPTIHLVFEPDNTWIYGVLHGPFRRTLTGQGQVLGIRFHPGGFRPLLGHRVSYLTNTRSAASDLLPGFPTTPSSAPSNFPSSAPPGLSATTSSAPTSLSATTSPAPPNFPSSAPPTFPSSAPPGLSATPSSAPHNPPATPRAAPHGGATPPGTPLPAMPGIPHFPTTPGALSPDFPATSSTAPPGSPTTPSTPLPTFPTAPGALTPADAESHLLPLLPEPDPTVDEVRTLVSTIATNRTLTRVADLATHSGRTVRSIQRLFNEYVGVGPKWVIRRYRMHEAATRADEGRTVDWSALALDLGFSDQAHFTREFTAAIGTSPAKYAARR